MNELENPEQIEQPDIDQEQLEDLSPSFRGGSKKPTVKDKAKDKAKEKAKDKGKDIAKKPAEAIAKKGLRQVLLNAARAVGAWIASAVSAIIGAIGWPYLVGCLAIFLIIILVFGGIGAVAINGYFGKTLATPAGPNDANVKALIGATTQVSKGGKNKLDFKDKRDFEYVQSGNIDKRLAAALNYLVQKHEHIRISHIVSGYESTKVNPESGSFHDQQITKNISAHRAGLAADIDEIDFVKEKCSCGNEIPVKVSWQGIGENPYGEVPDALSKITKGEDLLNLEVKEALEKSGVSGLDQEDLQNKIAAVPVLANIKDVYDLTNPEVIAALEALGINGVGNQTLQTGLKRIQALQQLYELSPSDLTSLQNPQVQDLFNQAGVPISAETITAARKYQATQALSSITSISDLQKPEVQDALKTLGVNYDDPNFPEGLKKIMAASTIVNFQGDPSDQAYQDALSQFGLSANTDFQKALEAARAARSIVTDPGMTTDAKVVAFLDNAKINVDDPQTQKAIAAIKASWQIFHYEGSVTDPEFAQYLQEAGVNTTSQNVQNIQKVVDKYRAAQDILNYRGDYTAPEFLNSLNQVGITLDANTQAALEKYKAAATLSQAARGDLARDSQEVKDALKVFGANSLNDEKSQAAIRVADSKDQNDNQTKKDKEYLGMNRSEWQDTFSKTQAARNLLKIRDFTSINDPVIQANLKTLGLEDQKIQNAVDIIGTIQTLKDINLKDIGQPMYQEALRQLSIDNPGLIKSIGKIGDLQSLLEIKNIGDLNNPQVKEALKNLDIDSPALNENLGKLGSIQTLLEIKSPLDLTKPEVIEALSDLKVSSEVTQQLANVGSIYTLTQINKPSDLLQPQSLEALSQLGIIDLNAEFLGQVAAVQTLLQVQDFKDLMNPSSILALNSLGIISLSNPVTTGLMVVSMVDNLLGGKILGSLFGKCKASTACYKPSAQGNVHTAVSQLLQMPYDLGNPDYYRLTQLITYSDERDVLPFSAELDKLYGSSRPSNVGLFSMPEALDHLHIAY